MTELIRLRDVPAWQAGMSCVVTSLASILGQEPDAVAAMNSVAASMRTIPEDFPPDIFRPVPINFWLDSLRIQGLIWIEEATPWPERPYDERPSISDYFGQHVVRPGVFLVLGERLVEGKPAETHVFPVEGDSFLDGYTEGKIQKIGRIDVPADFDEFRVKRIFVITMPEAGRCSM